MKKTLSQLVILSVVGVASIATPAFTAEATIEQGTQFRTSRLEELNQAQRHAQAELDEINSIILETETESEKMVEEIEKTAAQLEELNEEIEELKQAIDARELKLQNQARAVQISGETGNLLDFIIEAESFSDVLGRLDVVSSLVGANRSLVQQQKEDKEAVEQKESETKEKQEEQMKLAAQLENKKVALEEKQAQKEVLIASIAAEKAEIQSERNQYLAQRDAAVNRVNEVQNAQAASQTSSRTVSGQSNSRSVSSQKTNKAPAPSVSGGSIINNAHALTGVRYSWGGTTTAGFDCSGFTTYVYQRAGKSLPRTASGQYAASTKILQSQAQPGDLIFFNQTGSIDHVGIYLGGGKFIGAQTSTGVAVASFTSGYWARYVVGFGRVN